MGSLIILRNIAKAKSICEGIVTVPVGYFHLDVCQSNKQTARELRFMNKLMTKGRPKRAFWYKTEQSTGQSPLFTKNVFKYDHRRQVVLNKLFMRNITEIMATGEVASEFVGHGIEISGVKVTPDFKMVNVYWVAKESDLPEIEEILKRSAKMLQHELTQLQLMGVMPRIQFVKDNHYAQVMEIDRRLNEADYGEEYIPLNSCYRLKPEFSNPESNCSVTNLEEPEVEPIFPPMRMDVLGLNHADVMAKIKRSKKKAVCHHGMDKSEVEYPAAEHCEQEFHHVEFKKEEFSQFLMKRRIAKRREKYAKNYFPEQELYENELLNESTLYDELTEHDENDYMQE